jgi:hypothetical protein
MFYIEIKDAAVFGEISVDLDMIRMYWNNTDD